MTPGSGLGLCWLPHRSAYSCVMWPLMSAMMSVLPVAGEVLAVQFQPVPASYCWVTANCTGFWSPRRWAVGRAAGSTAWAGGEATALQGCGARGGLVETESSAPAHCSTTLLLRATGNTVRKGSWVGIRTGRWLSSCYRRQRTQRKGD